MYIRICIEKLYRPMRFFTAGILQGIEVFLSCLLHVYDAVLPSEIFRFANQQHRIFNATISVLISYFFLL